MGAAAIIEEDGEILARTVACLNSGGAVIDAETKIICFQFSIAFLGGVI